jgi:hypothetical protein
LADAQDGVFRQRERVGEVEIPDTTRSRAANGEIRPAAAIPDRSRAAACRCVAGAVADLDHDPVASQSRHSSQGRHRRKRFAQRGRPPFVGVGVGIVGEQRAAQIVCVALRDEDMQVERHIGVAAAGFLNTHHKVERAGEIVIRREWCRHAAQEQNVIVGGGDGFRNADGKRPAKPRQVFRAHTTDGVSRRLFPRATDRHWRGFHAGRGWIKPCHGLCLNLVAELGGVDLALRPCGGCVGVLFDDLTVIAIIGADILGVAFVIRAGHARERTEGASARIVLARGHVDLNAENATRDRRKVAAVQRVALPHRVAVVVGGIAVQRRVVEVVPVAGTALFAEFRIVARADGTHGVDPHIAKEAVVRAARAVADVKVVDAVVGAAPPDLNAGGGRERGGLLGVAREVEPCAFVDAHLPVSAAVRDGELHFDIVPGEDGQCVHRGGQQRAACHRIAVNTDRAVVADGQRALDRSRLVRKAKQFRCFGGDHVEGKADDPRRLRVKRHADEVGRGAEEESRRSRAPPRHGRDADGRAAVVVGRIFERDLSRNGVVVKPVDKA